jgi:phage tail-like protein
MSPVGDRVDPALAHHFVVELQGIARGGFREVTGLASDQPVVEYREGTDAPTARKLLGLNTYSNITLRWGTTTDSSLWEWRKAAMAGRVERKNGSIVLLDETGQEVRRWAFHEAVPTSWKAPSFNATGNDVAVEELVLAVEGVEEV